MALHMDEIVGKKLILVLGSHRSGTSLVTSIVKKLGFNLGNDLLPGSIGSNVYGHFEDVEILDFNESVLMALGTDWRTPDPFSNPKSDFDEALYRSKLIELLDKKIYNQSIRAIKEPRIPILIDLWEPILSKLSLDICVLVAIRHPNEVSASLWKRDKLNIVLGAQLWARSTINSIRFARDYKNKLIFYIDLINNPLNEINSIRSSFDLSHNDSEPDDQIIQNISKDLHHNRSLGDQQPLIRVVHEIYNYICNHKVVDRSSYPDSVLNEWDEELRTLQHSILTNQVIDLDNELISTTTEKYSSERDSLVAERDSLVNSISWRVTKPVRLIIARLIKIISFRWERE